MRILHVIAGVDESGGGMSEVVPRMCEELIRYGHSAKVLTLSWTHPSTMALRAVAAGVEIEYCSPSRILPLSLAYSSEFAKRITDAIGQVDVIHLNGLWQWPCWKAAREAIRQRKPFVMQTHGFLKPTPLKRSRFKKVIVGRLIERPILSYARRVIATAESEKDDILRYKVRTPVEVVPIGIDTHDIEVATRDENLLRRLGVPSGKKVLLYLSRLAPIKGLDMLADAWMRLRKFHDEWHLLIVGDDTQGFSETIKRQYAGWITDGSASLPGPVYGPDKFKLLKSADAFVLPTRSENFGIAVLEALAAGLPVVCTKGAPWSVIAKDNAGRWVDISVDGIENGLCDVMSCNQIERDEMGEAGRQIASRDYSWHGVTRRLLDVYSEVIAEW